jgi:uncharacterized protein
MAAFLYEFAWDPLKADSNRKKHGVDFEQASTVFLDPLAISIPDEEHSEAEERWITLGKDGENRYVLVIHTFEWLPEERGRVRLISARRPTAAEIRDYEEPREA